MTTTAPRAFNRTMYHDQRQNVFYGTDDGCQDGSFREFAQFKAHFDGLDPHRREDIHMVSVVGGLYGLNFLPLWKPSRVTIYDINPAAVAYFRIVRRVWLVSSDPADFERRLAEATYPVDGELEEFVRENIRLKQAGELPRSRGSTKRPYAQSFQYAFEHFDETKRILRDVPLEIRCEPMESASFADVIRRERNLYCYLSNITEFHWFDLDLDDPANAVFVQIIYPGNPQLLDLAALGGAPTKVHFRIPMWAEHVAS